MRTTKIVTAFVILALSHLIYFDRDKFSSLFGDEAVEILFAKEAKNIFFLFAPHEKLFLRPIPLILYHIEHKLWGTNPWGYHIVTIALRIMSVYVSFFIMYKIIKLNHILTLLLSLCLSVNLFFAEQFMLGDVGGILSFLLLSLSILSKDNLRISLPFFTLSLLSKEDAFILPFIILMGFPTFERFELKKAKAYFLVLGIYLILRLISFIGKLGGYSWLEINFISSITFLSNKTPIIASIILPQLLYATLNKKWNIILAVIIPLFFIPITELRVYNIPLFIWIASLSAVIKGILTSTKWEPVNLKIMKTLKTNLQNINKAISLSILAISLILLIAHICQSTYSVREYIESHAKFHYSFWQSIIKIGSKEKYNKDKKLCFILDLGFPDIDVYFYKAIRAFKRGKINKKSMPKIINSNNWATLGHFYYSASKLLYDDQNLCFLSKAQLRASFGIREVQKNKNIKIFALINNEWEELQQDENLDNNRNIKGRKNINFEEVKMKIRVEGQKITVTCVENCRPYSYNLIYLGDTSGIYNIPFMVWTIDDYEYSIIPILADRLPPEKIYITTGALSKQKKEIIVRVPEDKNSKAEEVVFEDLVPIYH